MIENQVAAGTKIEISNALGIYQRLRDLEYSI